MGWLNTRCGVAGIRPSVSESIRRRCELTRSLSVAGTSNQVPSDAWPFKPRSRCRQRDNPQPSVWRPIAMASSFGSRPRVAPWCGVDGVKWASGIAKQPHRRITVVELDLRADRSIRIASARRTIRFALTAPASRSARASPHASHGLVHQLPNVSLDEHVRVQQIGYRQVSVWTISKY